MRIGPDTRDSVIRFLKKPGLLDRVELAGERVVRERRLQQRHRVDEPVRLRRLTRHRGRHDAAAEAVADDVDAHVRQVGADASNRFVHPCAADGAGALLHLIVRHVVEEIRRAGGDALEEVAESRGALEDVIGGGRLVSHARAASAAAGRDFWRRASELLQKTVVGDHGAGDPLVRDASRPLRRRSSAAAPR